MATSQSSCSRPSVSKHVTSAGIRCLGWSPDGALLALGMMDANVSLRDARGTEVRRISLSSRVSTLQWSPTGSAPVLAIGCGDQTLSFYDEHGKQQGSDVPLGISPCCISYGAGDEHLCLGGSDGSATLLRWDGVHLSRSTERPGTSVRSCAIRSAASSADSHVAIGCDDGTISMLRVKGAEVEL